MMDALTEREREVLALVMQGHTNQEIADTLHLAVTTIKWYNTQIYEKLNVTNRKQAAAVARRQGLLNTAQPTPNTVHLPNQVTPFIGRKTEISEINGLLADTETSIITLLGPGGIGKTRLAIEAAARHAYHFPQGVYFVGLAPVSNPDALLSTIMDALRYPVEQGVASVEDQLINRLENRKLLLVLDNIEHLLAGISAIGRLCKAAPGVKVMVTSRERLNLTGETIYTLTGLTFPAWNAPDDVMQYDAVQLFVQRARHTRPDFDLNADDLDHLARICELTQGMPLGIELAAGWIDTLTLAQIADEIKQGIDILETELRDVPERHRSIRAAIDYSWNGLAPAEQTVFLRLAVFRGGFDTAGAAAVAGATPRILRKLVSKALIYRLPDGRYLIHELLRQYAEDKLHAQNIYAEIRRAHADFYTTMLADQYTSLSEGRLTARHAIEPEVDNVLTAWHWLVITADFDALFMVGQCVWAYLSNFGRNYDGIPLFQWTREQLEPHAKTDDQRLVYGTVVLWLAELTLSIEAEEGYAQIKNAITILEALPPSLPLAWAYGMHGNLDYQNGQITIAESEMWLRKALQVVENLDAEEHLPEFLNLLSLTMWRKADYDEARRLSERALALAQAMDSDYQAAMARGGLARVDYIAGDLEAAREHLLTAAAMTNETGQLYRISQGLLALATIAHAQSNLDEARAYLVQLIRWNVDHGQDWQLLGGLVAVANMYITMKQPEQAVSVLAMVQNHPFTSSQGQEHAKSGLIDARKHLDEDTYAAAYARGQTWTLDGTVDRLLTEMQSE